MVFEQLAQTVLNFVNWGITIVVIMLIWEIIQFLRGGTEDRGVGEWKTGKKSLGEIKDSFNQWTGRADVEKKKKIVQDAARDETAELNEYIEEKEELQKINSAATAALGCANLLRASTTGSKVLASSIKDSFDDLKKLVDEAGKETNKLKQNTWRARRRTKQLYTSLDQAGVSKSDLDKVRSLENLVLKNHEAVITHLATAAGAIKRIDSTIKSLANIKGAVPPKSLESLRDALINFIKPALEKAQVEQGSAYKNTQDFIARIRKVWK